MAYPCCGVRFTEVADTTKARLVKNFKEKKHLFDAFLAQWNVVSIWESRLLINGTTEERHLVRTWHHISKLAILDWEIKKTSMIKWHLRGPVGDERIATGLNGR